MTIGVAARNWLNEKQCWDDWLELGSLEKVRMQYQRNGILNNATGDPPTQSAIQKAAYRWALRNIEEAKRCIEFEWEKEGRFLNEEEWKRYWYRMVKIIYYQSPLKFKRMVEENGLEPYAN